MVWNKLFGKSKSQNNASTDENQRLIGFWILKDVGGNQPPVTMHVLHFLNGGIWNSQSILLNSGGGHFEMSGGGAWKIKAGMLSFTTGENSGETKITFDGNFIALAKDPLLQLQNYADKTCVYERKSESEVAEFAAYLRNIGESMSGVE